MTPEQTPVQKPPLIYSISDALLSMLWETSSTNRYIMIYYHRSGMTSTKIEYRILPERFLNALGFDRLPPDDRSLARLGTEDVIINPADKGIKNAL